MDIGMFFFISLTIGIIGGFLSLLFSKKTNFCIKIAFISSIIAACFQMVAGILVLVQGDFTMTFLATHFGNYGFTIDKMAAFFTIIISLLTILVSIYSLDYVKEYENEYNIGYLGFMFNMFYLSLIFVIVVNNAILFLIAWEFMSLTTYFMVVYENKNKDAVSAGTLYFVMSHLGTAFIIVSFLVFASYTNSFEFLSFYNIGDILPPEIKNMLFIFLLIGFGSKASIFPMHIWLPTTHSSSPSNVTSLLSGVGTKTGIFMIIRVVFQFLGVSETWWGLLLVVLGCISAVMGILYANVEKNIKQIVAYSSIENVGIITIALGTSIVFISLGQNALGTLALIAGLLHVLNHSLFKGGLFLGIGSITYATKSKDIESLGGLIKRMPKTSVFFFILVLAAACIPPLNGFISEWLVVQSMLLSFNLSDMGVRLIFPFALAAMALVTGLTVTCFLRLFGISFLAEPRSKQAEEAKEVPKTMLVGIGIFAFLCLLTGLIASLIIPVIDQVAMTLTNTSVSSQMVDQETIFPIYRDFVSVSTPQIIKTLSLMIPVVFYLSQKFGKPQKTEYGDSWDCGTPLTARNEYSGTAFSAPINRVFKDVYKRDNKVKTVPSESPYIFRKKEFISKPKVLVVDEYFYKPIVNGIKTIASKVRKIQNGNISSYLLYIFITLIVTLSIVRWF